MQQLIEDLLAYSRTKSSERVFENTNINAMLNEIKGDLAETIKKEKVTIEYSDLNKIKIIPS
jgi:light-regulated signal transduction histidine kinase (bacteriophytochrome)